MITPDSSTGASDKQPESLVDEKEDPKVLELREENRKLQRHNADIASKLAQLQQFLDNRNEQASQPKSPQARGKAQPAAPVEALIPTGDYAGPGLKEVYLAVLQGLVQKLPITNDTQVDALAQHAIGISEVAFHKLIRRPNFRTAKQEETPASGE